MDRICRKAHRLTMSIPQTHSDAIKEGEAENITTRKGKQGKGKMEVTSKLGSPDNDGSLFIDSILSQDEMEDIHNMLETEENVSRKFDLFTSTQLGRNKRYKPSLDLSPIRPGMGLRSSALGNDSILLNNRFSALLEHEGVLNQLNKADSMKQGNQETRKLTDEINGKDESAPGDYAVGEGCLDDRVPVSALGSVVQGSGGDGKHGVEIGKGSAEAGNEGTERESPGSRWCWSGRYAQYS